MDKNIISVIDEVFDKIADDHFFSVTRAVSERTRKGIYAVSFMLPLGTFSKPIHKEFYSNKYDADLLVISFNATAETFRQ